MSSKDVLELFGDGWEAREHNPTGLRLSTGILHGGPYAYMETFKGFGGPRLTVSEATQLRDALSKWLAEDCKQCGHPNADHSDGIDPLLPPYGSE